MLSGTDKPLLKVASIVAYEHHENGQVVAILEV